jgi:hypothetical protein
MLRDVLNELGTTRTLVGCSQTSKAELAYPYAMAGTRSPQPNPDLPSIDCSTLGNQ